MCVVYSLEDLLALLVKLVHYNSAYLEEDVLSQLISHTCSLATQPSSPSETEVNHYLYILSLIILQSQVEHTNKEKVGAVHIHISLFDCL